MAGNEGTSNALSVTIDTTAPTASTPDLDADSDKGASNSDNITNDSTPTFSGTAEAGSTVELFDGTTSVGTTTANNTGNWTYTISSALSDGTHNIAAKATDVAGNVGSLSNALGITIDTVAPTVSAPDLAAASDSGNSNTDNITNDTTPTFSGTAEAGSTVKILVDGNEKGSETAAGGSYNITTSTLSEGVHSVTAKATDVAGNDATSSAVSITIDTTAPSLTVPADISVGATSASGAVVTYTASATDSVDGSVTPTCTPSSGSTFQLGETTVNCSAKDAAGNEATGSFKVKVTVTLKGFYQPVDMSTGSTPVYNTVKGGSTVPLKFEVFGANNAELTDTSIISQPLSSKQINCASGATEAVIEQTATGGTSLRYDSSAGQFIYNWQTPKGPVGSCYQVTVSPVSGSGDAIIAYFKLK